MIARLLAFLAVLLVVSPVRADRCGDDARAWIERCAKSSGVAMELAACPASVAIVATKEVRVEISTNEKAFRRVGAYGVSPIGDFSDWELEPESRRRAFEAVAQCVATDPPRALLSGDEPARAIDVGTKPRAPWLLLAGVGLAIVACVRRARGTAIAVAALCAIFLLRRWLQPFAFFHQNGQGPQWIDFAYRGGAGEYGPGYPEIFGWVSHVRRPERGVAVLQELLAATVPLSAYAIARSSGAARATALVFGAALAFDPVLVRIARSESYFSVMAALVFAAAAVLALADLRHRVLGLLASALFVAEAARVHPLAWVPCALVPLVLFCRPGRPRDRAKRTAVAAAVIAVVVAPFVLSTMRSVLRGELGTGFMPGVRAIVAHRGVAVALCGTPFVALAFVPRTRKLGTRLAVLAIVVAVAALADVLKGDASVVRAAHLHLFLPAAIAALAFVQFRASVGLLAMLVLGHVSIERRLLLLPTDARELSWALEWREELPRGAEVASLERADHRILFLPLVGQDLPTLVRIDREGGARFGLGPRFYYRSSLCSTPEGAPVCARFESAHRLKPLGSRRFSAIASLPWAPLPPGEIEVELYSVE